MGAYLHNRLLKVLGAGQLHRWLMSLMTLFTLLSLAQRETFVVSLYLLPGAWSTGLTVEKPVSLKIQGAGSPTYLTPIDKLYKPAPTPPTHSDSAKGRIACFLRKGDIIYNYDKLIISVV
jgi:hypothetical protein